MAKGQIHYALIAMILIVAVVVRIFAFSPYAIHHPDEAVQYLEQAHRLAFGPGLIPWEYRFGMRSWLVPLLLAGPMALGQAIAPGTLLYVVLARATAGLIAFAPVFAAYRLGNRFSLRHALVAMAVMAVWYESVYFSVHVLTEPLAVAAVLSAAAVLEPEASRRHLIAGGALLMLAAVFRIQYAPAIAAYALVAYGRDRRTWWWLALGGVAIALASGSVDLAMGQWPFGWAWANIDQNVIADKASGFGRLGPETYPVMLWLHWQVAIVPILWFAVIGARRYPALATAALVNLALHVVIGHKEYRFILLTGQIAILLAAIGSVDVIDRWRAWRPVMLAALVAGWAASSAALAASSTADPGWRRFESGNQLARIAAERRSCGVALIDESYWLTNQTYLHGIPIYYVKGRTASSERQQLADSLRGYDVIIATPGHAGIPSAYRLQTCRGDGPERLCLSVRSGGCTHDALSDTRLMQRVMEANGR